MMRLGSKSIFNGNGQNLSKTESQKFEQFRFCHKAANFPLQEVFWPEENLAFENPMFPFIAEHPQTEPLGLL